MPALKRCRQPSQVRGPPRVAKGPITSGHFPRRIQVRATALPTGAAGLESKRSDDTSKAGYVRRAFALNRPELPWVGLGFLGAI